MFIDLHENPDTVHDGIRRRAGLEGSLQTGLSLPQQLVGLQERGAPGDALTNVPAEGDCRRCQRPAGPQE